MATRTPRSRPAGWRQGSPEEARSVLARFDASGKSLAAYARSIGVSEHRLTYWRAKFAAQPAPSLEAAAAPRGVAPFVPVQVLSRPAIEPTLGALSLRLPADTSDERVVALFTALARRVGAC